MKERLPEIEARLAAVRRRIRRAQLLRGGGLVLTVALAGLALIMAADYALSPLPGAARWALWVVWLAVLLLALAKALDPLRRRIRLVSVARWIEHRHPEIEERLSTALEVGRDESMVSNGLIEELLRAAGKDAGALDPQVEVKPGLLARRWGRPALVLLGLLLLAFVIRPGDTFRLVVRAVAPFSQMGSAGASRLAVKPGDLEVLEGDAVTIGAGWSGAEVPEVVIIFGDEREVRQPMTRTDGGYRYVLEPAKESFRYRIRVGRVESDAYQAKVWPLPRINGPRVLLDYPAYTALPKKDEALGSRVEAVAGTRVELTGELNTGIEQARLEIDGQPPVPGGIDAAAGGGRVSFAWTLQAGKSGEARVYLKHRLGRETEALRFPVEVLADQPPAVVLLSPAAKELRVRPEEVLELRYEVTEDLGVAAAMLEAETAGKDRLVRPQPLPVPASRTKPPRYRGTIEAALGELYEALGKPGEIRVRVVALDARPPDLAGPGRGESRWLVLKIDAGAESMARQQAREEHDGAREEMSQAARMAREARERMDWHRNDAKEGKFDERTREHFNEAAERLAQAQEQMEQLAARMEESVHSTKAAEVRQAAEMMKQARQELESVPLQDDAAKRDSKMDFARNAAEDASKKLEQTREAMERERAKIEDLVKLQELAAKQQELARQAATQATAEKQPDEWKGQQRGVEEALKQQLREQPEAKAVALEKQAAEAQEMAAEAREQAAAQQKLAEQPGAPEAVQAAATLARQQQEIAQEVREALGEARDARSAAADLLPQAADSSRQAAEALAKGEDASKAAKEAAADLAHAAKAAETGKTSQASEAGKTGETSQANEAGKTGETSQANEAGKTGESSQANEAGKTGESSQANEAGKAGEASQANEAGKTGEASQANEAPKSPAEVARTAARAEALRDLATRQEQVAQALAAAAEGRTAEAVQAARAMQAEEAKNFSGELESLPQLEGSGPLNDARAGGWQARDRAKAAAERGGEGKVDQAANEHREAAKGLEKSAEALDRAAEDLKRQAAEAQGRQAESSRKAPMPAQTLAQAFDHAAEAARDPSAAQAAVQAGQAADALAETARAARERMQGRGPNAPGKPMPGAPMPGQDPGRDPQEGMQQRQADPGVPPELAKLGVSAEDWEKIKESMKSEVGGPAASGVPEEYQGLVRDYFRSMSDSHENNN